MASCGAHLLMKKENEYTELFSDAIIQQRLTWETFSCQSERPKDTGLVGVIDGCMRCHL